jgi:hypothetical protein
LSLGCVHPFEKAVDDGVVLERGFRAPPAASEVDPENWTGC